MRPPKKRSLTIYLLKEGATLESAIDPRREVVQAPVTISADSAGTLVVRPSQPKPPAWMEFFGNAADLSGLEIINSSSAAVLFTERSGRLFAITFGQGRHVLTPGCWEENFGLRVTLNAVSPDRIRSIDKETFDAIARHTREQAIADAPMRQFGLDVEQDLLRAVVGTPDDEADGHRLTGRDALVLQSRVTLVTLGDSLGRALERFGEDGYKEKFPWVDRLNEVRDSGMKATLDGRLLEQLRAGDLEHCWLAVPEILDWERVGGFQYGPSRSTEEPDFDVHLSRFLAALEQPEAVDLEALNKRKVLAVDAAGDTVVESWPVYKCLYAEFADGGDAFLLSGGRWYRVQRDFVGEVDEHFRSMAQAVVALPVFEARDTEKTYNARVAANGEFVLMDRNNIRYGGGAGQIEFCDLYSRDRQLIHVKRYGGSTVLSHLFAQGVVAGRLLHEPQFRQAVNTCLPPSHKLEVHGGRPAAGDFEVVYAIVSQSQKDLWLPFFSRVNLRQASKELDRLGFRVSLAKIPVVAP